MKADVADEHVADRAYKLFGYQMQAQRAWERYLRAHRLFILLVTFLLGCGTGTAALMLFGSRFACVLPRFLFGLALLIATANFARAQSALGPAFTSCGPTVSSCVIRAAPGNLVDWGVTTAAVAGYVMIINAMSAPSSPSSVTPAVCEQVAAEQSLGGAINPPGWFSTGIVVLFSTTGCGTYTASATAFIQGRAQ